MPLVIELGRRIMGADLRSLLLFPGHGLHIGTIRLVPSQNRNQDTAVGNKHRARRHRLIPSLALTGIQSRVRYRLDPHLPALSVLEAQQAIHTIKLGPWAITGLPGEIYTEIGIKIKVQSPFEHTLIFELANGTHGYIAPAYMVDSGVYESRLSQRNSCTDRTTADMLVEKSLEHLNEIAGK
jgi:hypothetical protein